MTKLLPLLNQTDTMKSKMTSKNMERINRHMDKLALESASDAYILAERDRLKAENRELVEALQIIASWEPDRAPSERNGMSIIDAIDIARAALAKAQQSTK